ncbi:hypothetical protein ACH3XW_22595 [Acanthocheilonema viteae]
MRGSAQRDHSSVHVKEKKSKALIVIIQNVIPMPVGFRALFNIQIDNLPKVIQFSMAEFCKSKQNYSA